MEILFFYFVLGCCWGSFLNVVSYRLTFDKPFFAKRSHCPHCNTIIAWYYNIPLFSWFWLKRQSACCKKPISWLYPFIEFVSGITFALLAITLLPQQPELFFTQALFFSALIAATRSDLEALVIPQAFTLYLIPIGFLLTAFSWNNITIEESIIACLFAYGFLWILAKVFGHLKKQEALGLGDAELLALIGTFLGFYKMWTALMIGSTIGCIGGILYLLITKQNRNTRIPFGPFLALGALISFFYNWIIMLFLLP